MDLVHLFYECEESDIASYADDTTPYFCGTDTPSVITEIQITANKRFYWSEYNHLKANPVKSHLLLSTTTLLMDLLVTYRLPQIQLKFYLES